MQLAIAPNTVSEANRDIMPTAGTPGWLTDGNPATGVPASGDAACVANMIMAEIIQPILDAGLTLDAADWGQLSAAIKILVQKGITAASLVALDQIACQQGTNGYLKIPVSATQSILIQWGTFSGVTDNGPTNGIYECSAGIGVSWPIAFSTLFIALAGNATDVTGYGQQEQAWIWSSNVSGGKFSVACRTQNATMTGSYIAIGMA
ncbi:hypothetical protein MSKU15_1027 [Komagataeibacter diospyri]|uniref:hypothetical protein n=1 Tax=Komagataeibacter diospyri TaxID=1932662 RepID=UPI001134F300|nr:hypothetical protein [Komagataeibacter diospyri]GCE89426.1 hypothetical protein MSKU15_1027 [Komagataeibacter diospyri]